MSIKEMIQDHPAVGDDYNDQQGEAVKHTMYAAAIINSCADACNVVTPESTTKLQRSVRVPTSRFIINWNAAGLPAHKARLEDLKRSIPTMMMVPPCSS